MTKIARYQAHDHCDNIVSALVNSGVVVVENLLEETVVAGLNTDLRAEFDREGHLYQNSFNGHKTLRVGGRCEILSSFCDVTDASNVLAVADAVLKPHCEVYQVGSTTAIEILPGEEAQVLHADDTCYPSHLLPFEAQISALWALDDFTEQNGATRVVPKECDITDPEQVDDEHIVQAVMPRGRSCYTLARRLHGGGKNLSDA